MLRQAISFVGSGNLAWHLAPALDNAGFVVKEVYSRNPLHAEALTGRLYQAEIKATLDFSTSHSSVFFICVNDDAIREVAQEIILPEAAILVHTSGSQPASILQFAAAAQTGVFYPLQTFSSNRKLVVKDIPIFIEGSDDETSELLIALAKAISTRVSKITSADRLALHIAAVFAANFTNHMLSISKDLLSEHGLDFEWLVPLITETINKSLSAGPHSSQTGPARRGDLEVLDSHLLFLQNNEARAEIYKVISQHIVDTYNSE